MIASLTRIGAHVTIHCTITSQIAQRPGYLDEFLAFWSSRPEVARIWFSISTPQFGATDVEILTPAQRSEVIAELRQLRMKYPVLHMQEAVIDEIARPPRSLEDCIFARTTETISADLTTHITPCQFGGQPVCAQCGCMASMGLAAVAHHKVLGPFTAGQIFMASDRLSKSFQRLRRMLAPKPVVAVEPVQFQILRPELQRHISRAGGETH